MFQQIKQPLEGTVRVSGFGTPTTSGENQVSGFPRVFASFGSETARSILSNNTHPVSHPNDSRVIMVTLVNKALRNFEFDKKINDLAICTEGMTMLKFKKGDLEIEARGGAALLMAFALAFIVGGPLLWAAFKLLT